MKMKHSVRALTFKYHGIARRELEAAGQIAVAAGIQEHQIVRLPDLKEAGKIRLPILSAMPPTYIPMRNSVFYSLAASYAEEVGVDMIVGGHNKDDTRSFADAAPEFFEELKQAFWIGSPILRERRTKIFLPLSMKTKVQVIKIASSLGVPLRLTWSCHRDGKGHCWHCDGCRARIVSFTKAGVLDPLRGPNRAGKIS